ncbi:MAG: alpha/beta fold hydrolase, partial [Candidatus Ornithomonoglobus sp.]
MKKTILTLTFIFIAIMAFITALAVTNKIISYADTRKKAEFYGQTVEVHGENMCVDVQGNGEHVVVLLPGWGTYAPILDFKPLTAELKDNYTVVTIEYFGYGLSDLTNKPRTIENITLELHTALEKLGYNQYILIAHSISGVYGIYYAYKYPEEVKAFVGIEASFPEQTDEDENLILAKGMANLGLYRLFTIGDERALIQNGAADYYTEEELKNNRKIALKNMLNKNVYDEYKLRHENFKKAEDLLFESNIPVLHFLSNESVAEDVSWESGRLKYMTNPNSRIV